MKKSLEITDFKKVTGMFQYGKHVRPLRDWFVLLTVMVIALLGSVGYNIWLLLQVQKGEAIGDVTVPATLFNIAPLKEVDRIFNARKEEEKRIKTEYRFVDPSGQGS